MPTRPHCRSVCLLWVPQGLQPKRPAMDSAAPQAAAVARAASAATNGSAAADDGGAALLDNVGSLLQLVSEAGADGAAQQGKWVAQVRAHTGVGKLCGGTGRGS